MLASVLLEPTSPSPGICELLVHVAAVARVPPTRLQLIVAPERGGLEGPAAAGLDVPGLGMELANLGLGGDWVGKAGREKRRTSRCRS